MEWACEEEVNPVTFEPRQRPISHLCLSAGKPTPVDADLSVNVMQIDWEDLEPEQLPGDLREIATDCGLEVARYLVETWGGAMIYVPTLFSLKKEYRDRAIICEYNGNNTGTLAARMGVSRRYITRLVRENGGGGNNLRDSTDEDR